MSDERGRDNDHVHNVLAVALLSLMESNLPPDLLRLLVDGSLAEGVKPNALGKALSDVLRFTMSTALEVVGPPADRIHVQFADDNIRRWSREPFDGARTFVEIDNQPAQG